MHRYYTRACNFYYGNQSKELVNKKAKFIKLNILKTKDLKEIITVNNIDSVIHLAANLVIGEGEKQPEKYLKEKL